MATTNIDEFMPTNYEITHNVTLPQFRRAAAARMSSSYGMKQQDIAKVMHVSQAAVSKYLKSSKPKIKMSESDLTSYIKSLISGNEHGSRKALCNVCQSNRRFSCSFMVKQ